MKRFFKWIGTGLLVIVLAGGTFAAHEWYADKPFYFNNLLNREMVKVAFDSPETLTSLGLKATTPSLMTLAKKKMKPCL